MKKVYVLLSVVIISFASCNIKAQNSTIDSLKIELELHPQEDSIRVDILNELAFLQQLAHLTNIYNYSKNALTISKKINYLKGQAYSYFNISAYYWNISKFDSSLYYQKKAYNTFVKINDKNGELRSINLYAIINEYKGNYLTAIENHFKCLDICNITNNMDYTGVSYNNIGIVYSKLNNFNKALDYSYKAYKISIEQQDSFRMGICLNCIADYYLKLDSIEKAKEFYEKSLKINSKTNNLNILGNYYKGVAELFEKQIKYDSAHKYFIKAIDTYQEFNATRRLGYVYSLFAKHCIHTNQLSNSLFYAQKALNIGYECKDKELIRNSSNILRETYSEMNNYEKAYLYFDLYKYMEDNLQKNISLQSLAIMEAEYEYKLQQEKTELEHQTVLTKQKNAKTIFMASFFFVTVIVLLIAYALYQRIKRNSILRKANDTRDKMMRLIAHDFRSPLISISNTVQSIPMLIEEQDCDSIKEMCKSVEGSVTRVLTLIDNLINWTLSQHDSIPYNPDNYNLNDICNNITEIYKPIAEFKQIKLLNQITTDYLIYADKNILKTILRNLINNAIKFTPEKGEIILGAEQQNGKIKLSIQDNGVGMDQEKLKNIFSIGKDKSLGTKGEMGNGLGLFFCKEFALKNQGNIWVESEPGKGSVFYFTVPKYK